MGTLLIKQIIRVDYIFALFYYEWALTWYDDDHDHDHNNNNNNDDDDGDNDNNEEEEV